MNYYNEIDPHAAEWLRELIRQGSIPDGYVDERSIVDVDPSDLKGYRQCHFFAGIGALAKAVEMAGYADVEGLWTGSCPCQPFSAAGKGKGIEDDRHLWPVFFRLIEARRPGVVIGEQVASSAAIGKVATKAGSEPVGKDGWSWIDHVFDDLEGSHYACAADARAAVSVGAPNIRLRLYFVASRMADGGGERWDCGAGPIHKRQRGVGGHFTADGSDVDRMADAGSDRRNKGRQRIAQTGWDGSQRDSDVGRMDDTNEPRLEGRGVGGYSADQLSAGSGGLVNGVSAAGSVNGFWRDADWLFCTDEKWRPVKPGISCLVTGDRSDVVSGSDPSLSYCLETKEARKMRLQGYGNSVNLQQAAVFVSAAMESICEHPLQCQYPVCIYCNTKDEEQNNEQRNQLPDTCT